MDVDHGQLVSEQRIPRGFRDVGSQKNDKNSQKRQNELSGLVEIMTQRQLIKLPESDVSHVIGHYEMRTTTTFCDSWVGVWKQSQRKTALDNCRQVFVVERLVDVT